IAYVTSDGDEIRLVAPDGTGDRALWAHGLDDPEGVYVAWGLEWNPAATRLAFVSTHENWCSLLHSDVFVVGADGSGYGRVTQATVNVPVENLTFDSFSAFVYFQGAATLQPLNLAPRASDVVTFPQVADLLSGSGTDAWQVGVAIVADGREVLLSTGVDVPSSGAVTTAEAGVSYPDLPWEARSPAWDGDGETVAVVYAFNTLAELPPYPAPLTYGALLTTEGAELPGFVDHLARGPTDATADQVLFFGSDPFEDPGIYLVEEGAAAAGAPIVPVARFHVVKGIAWLPDGSGFVYSVTEGDGFETPYRGNVYRYEFASGDVTPLTSFEEGFVGDLSVSGDGTGVAFEYAAAIDELSGDLIDPDVYVLDVAGGDPQLLVANAYAPAWSW